MLAITADNATSNDVMVNELEDLVGSFQGGEMRVRCFNHILNLVVKMLLQQFNAEHKKKGANDATLDVAKAVLCDLTADLDSDDDGEGDADDIEGWVDERQDLTEEEIKELDVTTRPVKLVLAKVH